MTGLLATSRDRRAALIGLIAILSILAIGRGIPALRRAEGELRRRGEAAALAVDAARRERALVSAAATDGTVDEAFLVAESPTAGAALAVAYLTDVARALEVTVHSARPSGDSTFAQGVARVTVHLSLTASSPAIRAMIRHLESAPLLFRVGVLEIAQSAPAAPAGVEESLRLELTIDALARSPGSDEGTEPTTPARLRRMAGLAAARASRPLGRSPFRLDGGRKDVAVVEPAAPAAPVVLTPVVAVRAIVGGPPWQALLRGLPPQGVDRVVRPGDRFGVVEVRAIGAEFVVLSSADSSWTITLPSRGR